MRQSTKTAFIAPGAPVLFCRAALPLSRKTLIFAAGIIRRHRKAIGSRWRKLNPGQQALLVLAFLRKGETFAELAAGFGTGTTTGWRYVEETVMLLAARAPKLREAVRDAGKAGYAYVVPDGTLIPVGRVAADRPYQGSSYAKIPYRGRNKPGSQKQASKAHAKLRSPGERANAQLKTWRVLRKLRRCPWRAGKLAKAIHVVQAREA